MNKNDFTVWELPQDAIACFGKGIVCDLVVSADGVSLAVGSAAGVWWYDLTTRLPVLLFETGRGMIDCIALCSSQPWLAVNNSNKEGKRSLRYGICKDSNVSLSWNILKGCGRIRLEMTYAISVFLLQDNGLLQVVMVA